MRSLFQNYGLFRDDKANDTGTNGKEEVSSGNSVTEKMRDKSIISIDRNKSWLYETTAKLSIVASTVLKTINALNYMQSQNRYKLQLKIIELASTVIIDCSDTMSATCQDDFLEVVLQFSISSISDIVDKKARAVIHDAKQIFKSKPLNMNLWVRLENRFEKCLKERNERKDFEKFENFAKTAENFSPIMYGSYLFPRPQIIKNASLSVRKRS